MKTQNAMLLALCALLLGVSAGFLFFRNGTAAPDAGPPTADAAEGAAPTLYTCGMHPEVIQDHPGTCPQCGMTLTPLDADEGEESGGAASKDRKILYWVAPMDPSYVRDGPGKSPMGMDLVPVYEDEVRGGPTVKIDPVTEQNMGVRTAPVVKGPLVHEVRAVGTVAYDETKLGVVTLKVGGYVEKLFVDQTGASVKAGDPLFTMYAPEVVQAQDEYLRTRASLATATDAERGRWQDLFDQARKKLQRWDISDTQIAELDERGASRKDLVWYSPFDGIVLHKNAVEGAYFKPGEPLYRIAGLDTVWVETSIYEFEFPWVKAGQKARMQLPYYPGQTFEGVVDYVYPYLDPKTRDRKVRLVFPNPGRELLPDMFATVYIQARLAEDALLVPGEAVLDTGLRQVVFVAAGKGRFAPRDVQVGVEGRGGTREVLHGLAPGEYVVTSGQFLLDSESRIKEAIQKMMERRRSGASDGPATGGTATPEPTAFTAPDGLVPVAGAACPVMGRKPLPDVYVDYEGYRIFFCCTGCPQRFLSDPETYMAKLRRMGALPDAPGEGSSTADGAAVDPRFQAPDGLIPVVGKACPVMGGDPVPDVFVDYEGYRIFFCCPGCPPKFLADPGPYMAKLREMGALPAAPAADPHAGHAPPAPDPRFKAPDGLIPIVPKECPVMGGDPVPDVFVDYKGYRFFFCCPGCPEEFLAAPKPFIEKLRAEGFEIDIDD